MRRILLTSTARQPFVLDDAATLRKRFTLRVLIGSGPFAALKMFLAALRSDCSVIWFGSVYAWVVTAAAWVARKRSIIIIGGVDAAAIPELGYGIWLTPWKARLVRSALLRADRILAVDESLLRSLRSLTTDPLKHGRALPTGYDGTFWSPQENPSDTESPTRSGLLCVATCDSERRARVKGIDILLEAARLLPDLPFTVIGVDPSFAESFPFDLPDNVRLLPPVPREQLREYYRATALYCQPSRHEGLPNALCEAMLCGAIPIGTDVGGIRNVIGQTGPVVEPEDSEALADGIRRGLTMPESTRTPAREQILRQFSREAREIGLIGAIEELLGEERREA